MDSLYNCVKVVGGIMLVFEVLFIEAIVLYYIHPGFRAFLERDISARVQFIKVARRNSSKSWLISITVGMVFVFLMMKLHHNKPDIVAFNTFLEAHPAYSPSELINNQEEEFCTLHLLNVDGEFVNYLGAWNRFIMVTYLEGYWDRIEYKNKKFKISNTKTVNYEFQ